MREDLSLSILFHIQLQLTWSKSHKGLPNAEQLTIFQILGDDQVGNIFSCVVNFALVAGSGFLENGF